MSFTTIESKSDHPYVKDIVKLSNRILNGDFSQGTLEDKLFLIVRYAEMLEQKK